MFNTAASGSWQSVSPCQDMLHRTGATSSSASGVGNTAMVWQRKKVKTEKKGQGTGREGLADWLIGYNSGSCLHPEHLQRITSHRNAQFGRSAPFRGRLTPVCWADGAGRHGRQSLPACLPACLATNGIEGKKECICQKEEEYVQEGLGGLPVDPAPPDSCCPVSPIIRC